MNKRLVIILGIIIPFLVIVIVSFSNIKPVFLFSRASGNNSVRICAIDYATMKNTNDCCNNEELIKGYRCYLHNYSINCSTKNVVGCGRDNCNNETGLCKNQPNIIPSPPVGNPTTSRESSKYRTKPRQPNPTQVLPIPTVNLFPTSSQVNRTITISRVENEISEGYMGLRSVFYILNNNSPSYKVILSVLSAGSTDASSVCDPNFITLMINDEIAIVSSEDKVRIVTEKIYENNRQFVGYYVVDDDNNTRYFINKTIGPTQYVYIWPYEYDKNTGETIQPVPNRRKEYCILSP